MGGTRVLDKPDRVSMRSSGRFPGQRAIVSGGGSGIGRAVAVQLHNEGAEVFSIDIKFPQPCGNSVHELVCDVSDEGAVKKIIASTCANGQIDILVNAAAINPVTNGLDDKESWERVIAVNLSGVQRLTRHVVPHLGKGGAIINISSILANRGGRSCAAYTATKGAIEALTRCLALDLAPDIRVNCVAPGPVETPMFQEYLDRTPDPKLTREKIESHIPLGRIGTPLVVADSVCFLASSESKWITGATLTVDGGDSLG